tara:strand:+ start:316 stop:588 length:273 start_codon:yes stop_codon:yes gene_type:complete
MEWLSRYLSFEEPLGHIFTRLLFYIGIFIAIWCGLAYAWHALLWFDNDWDEALFRLIWSPFRLALSLLILRVAAEFVLSVLSLNRPDPKL